MGAARGMEFPMRATIQRSDEGVKMKEGEWSSSSIDSDSALIGSCSPLTIP